MTNKNCKKIKKNSNNYKRKQIDYLKNSIQIKLQKISNLYKK